MQYQLQIFQTEDHREFRTVSIDGEPWFYGIDVCNALEIKNPSDAYARLDGDDLGQTEGVDTRGRKQTFTIVNESGLFSLILRSDKPEAKRFKRWITSEVLPSIRKTGSYSTGAKPVPADWQPFHDRISAAWGAVPEGYFSIFKGSAAPVRNVIAG
jgi:prophage antirepressor-like protein